VPVELVADGRAHRARAAAVDDAHLSEPGECGVVDERPDCLARLLRPPPGTYLIFVDNEAGPEATPSSGTCTGPKPPADSGQRGARRPGLALCTGMENPVRGHRAKIYSITIPIQHTPFMGEEGGQCNGKIACTSLQRVPL